jgi:hypothetical protein
MSLNPYQTVDLHVEEPRILPILAKEEVIPSTLAMTIDMWEIKMGD